MKKQAENHRLLGEIGMCVAAFCLSVLLGLAALAVASFVPEAKILDTLYNSGLHLQREGEKPTVFDHKESSQLDNYTDALMLISTAGMNSRDLSSILTNPIFYYWHGDEAESDEELFHFAKDLQMFAEGTEPHGVWFYGKYWLGFRAILRVLLTHFDYLQIRRYEAVLFFLLFGGVVCSITKNVDSKTAMAFLVSILLVKPQVIVNSMQFSCCFLIAFAGMLLVPWVAEHPKWDNVFFLELGVVTMYFDFYTVPLVTMGFPLVYLAILRSRQGKSVSLVWVLRCALVWFAAYGMMWVVKLCLTTLFTSYNGLENGFQSFFGRVGIVKTEGLEDFYSVSRAFQGLKSVLMPDHIGKLIYVAGIGLALVSGFVSAFWNKVPFSVFRKFEGLLLIAILPILWFVVTKQPIAIHYSFQYRSIALTYWAAGAYLSMTAWNRGLQ